MAVSEGVLEFSGFELARRTTFTPEDPQTLRVTRELKDAEHPKYAQRDERSAEVLVVGHHQADVVRQDGHDVDDAHDARHVATSLGRRVQPQ